MHLRIRSITYLAEDVLGFELTDPNERDLPRFTAGAHVAIRVAPGLLRDYSLCNDPAERRRYCIAVLREKEKGKLRFIGLTEAAPFDLEHKMYQRALATDEMWDTAMVGFNMMHQNARTSVFPGPWRSTSAH